jgi:dUTP pyrophosphatase
MAQILNEIDAKNAAQKIVADSQAKQQERKIALEEVLNEIGKINPENGGFEEVATLLALPEEHFAILAPLFLSELEKSFKNVNDELAMAQAMNAAGIRAEDVKNEYTALCAEIEEQMSGTLSAQKRDFLKALMAITYNAVSETEGIAKRNILIPIEYCREGAKMPAYAHLTDAGMDVFATEEITINPGETKLIPLGIKVALPIGYELQVRPKSGRSLKSKLRVANTPGTIDAGYRDEIGVIVDNIDPYIKHAEMDENGRLYNVEFGSSITIGKGEKFAQLVLSEVPKAVFYEVETVAGMGEDRQGGFGSTGDK